MSQLPKVSCPPGARPLGRSGTQKTAVRSTYADTQLRTILGPDIMTDNLGRLRDWFSESSRLIIPTSFQMLTCWTERKTTEDKRNAAKFERDLGKMIDAAIAR
jgi:hypothetical protein